MGKCNLCDQYPFSRYRENDDSVCHVLEGGNTKVACLEPERATDAEIRDELRNEGANERYRG